MFWFLLLLIAAIAICSWLSPPGSSLNRSAWHALDSTVAMLSRGGGGDDDDDDGPPLPIRGAAPRREPRSQPAALSKTSAFRKRVTPLMQKRVAVKHNFRCALCNQPLDDTWETDHRIPLSQARSVAEAERLNSIDNLQPVHRACHQVKSSRETANR